VEVVEIVEVVGVEESVAVAVPAAVVDDLLVVDVASPEGTATAMVVTFPLSVLSAMATVGAEVLLEELEALVVPGT
jgi:hypothetical protein